MGGLGSSRWLGHQRRLTVGEVVPVTTMEVVRAANLDPAAPALRLSYRVDQRANADFWLEPAPQPFGGVRWWFRCPRCGRRRARLYAIGGSLQCRECARLVYATQRMDCGLRLQWKGIKLLRRAGLPPGTTGARPSETFPARPSGMHRHTFERVRMAYGGVLEAHEAWLWTETLRRFGGLLTNSRVR